MLNALSNMIINYWVKKVFEEIVIKPKGWGRMVECSIGAHLINHSLTNGFEVHYWREKNKEVDFVIEKRGK